MCWLWCLASDQPRSVAKLVCVPPFPPLSEKQGMGLAGASMWGLSPVTLDSAVGVSRPVKTHKHARQLAGPSHAFLGSLFSSLAYKSPQISLPLSPSLSLCVPCLGALRLGSEGKGWALGLGRTELRLGIPFTLSPPQFLLTVGSGLVYSLTM